MVAFFFQATGQVFSGHYGAVFVASLDTVNPFNITVSQTALNTFTSFIGIMLLDRVGRRPIWLAGSFGLMVALMIMGGLGVRQPISYSVSQGIVAMMLVSAAKLLACARRWHADTLAEQIFQMTYVSTIGPLYYTLLAETPSQRLRDKTVRVGATVNIVTMQALQAPSLRRLG